MILTVDIGNSNIVAGGLAPEKTYFVERLSTNLYMTSLEYAVSFKNILELNHIDAGSISGSIICSVVPPLTNTVREALERITGSAPLVVGPGIKTGLNIKMDNPAQLGSDLVTDAVAAIHEYGAPLLIFDLGTATTMSAIDKSGSYIGGAIIPGLKVSLDSLSSRASQLPRIGLESPKRIIGTNTIECMKSGAIYGNACMIDGMIDRAMEELKSPVKVVSTGGLARFITPCCKHRIIYDEILLLKGLLLIYRKNKAGC